MEGGIESTGCFGAVDHAEQQFDGLLAFFDILPTHLDDALK